MTSRDLHSLENGKEVKLWQKQSKKTKKQTKKNNPTKQTKNKQKTISSARFETQRGFVFLPNRRSLLIPLALKVHSPQLGSRQRSRLWTLRASGINKLRRLGRSTKSLWDSNRALLIVFCFAYCCLLSLFWFLFVLLDCFFLVCFFCWLFVFFNYVLVFNKRKHSAS